MLIEKLLVIWSEFLNRSSNRLSKQIYLIVPHKYYTKVCNTDYSFGHFLTENTRIFLYAVNCVYI